MLYVLIVGLAAGALAGLIMRGKGYGCLLNIVIGIIGAYVGNWLLPELGIYIRHGGFIGTLVTAVIGAVVFLFAVNLLKKILES